MSGYLAPGGMIYHVLNRGVGRRNLFDKADDFEAFERVLKETLCLRSMRVCAYCWMPNHWQFVLWPEHDGDLPAFMQQLTNTHVKRWKEHRHETGYGPPQSGTLQVVSRADGGLFLLGRSLRRAKRTASQLVRAG